MYIIHKSIFIYTLRYTNTVQEIRSTNTVQDMQDILMKTPESSEMERGLGLELWMINATRQLKALTDIMNTHKQSIGSTPLKLRKNLRKQV